MTRAMRKERERQRRREAFEVIIGHDLDGNLVAVDSRSIQKHILIAGKPGYGKSAVNRLMALQMTCHGQGFAMLDKDSKTAWDTLVAIPPLLQHPCDPCVPKGMERVSLLEFFNHPVK
ncbi:MAG: hypothetical protein KDB14_24610 [Planctomycetales bacterium]|nr:hypothetical protein [Planctomycetales bacterium]